MLLKKINFKTAIFGTTAWAIISNIAPEIGRAAIYKASLVGGGSQSTFFIKTGGSFSKGINDYNLVKSTYVPPELNLVLNPSIFATDRGKFSSLLPTTDESYTTLKYFEISNSIFYKYSFSIDDFNTLKTSLADQTEPLPFDSEGEIEFYIPDKFQFVDRGSNTSDCSTIGDRILCIGLPKSPKVDLLSTLKGLDTILSQAKKETIKTMKFPTNIIDTRFTSGTGGNMNIRVTPSNVDDVDLHPTLILEIDTTPIPEGSPLAGLLVLGLAGGLLILKGKVGDS